MKDKESRHKKVQEMIDCYATKNPLKEMSKIQNEKDVSEASIKWLALAELPSTGTATGNKIIQDIRAITHLEENNGESMLTLGVREGSIDIKVTVKKDYKGEEVVLFFPR